MDGTLFPTRWKDDKPPSIEAFMAAYPDDYACAEHLAAKRWADGFECPRCGSRKGWRLEAKPWVWECSGEREAADRHGELKPCRLQTSVIAGTVMHGTHLPLRTWFIAAYLVATHSNGISALQLQPKIGVGSYKTAWLLLHKLRRAMVNPGRAPLDGAVEVDETSVPYRTKDDPVGGGQGKSTDGKIFIIGAVERRLGRKSGRIRLARIEEDNGRFIRPFVLANTAADCLLHTDANSSYAGIPGRRHEPKNLSGRNALPAHVSFERIHRVFSNLKRWALGTFHGLREKHVDAYLHEFEFRWNRRRTFETSMDTLLGIGQALPRITYRDVVGDTTEWRAAHADAIKKMKRRHRDREAAKLAALVESLGFTPADLPPDRPERGPRRRPPRPVLPPRRKGEERPGRRPASGNLLAA